MEEGSYLGSSWDRKEEENAAFSLEGLTDCHTKKHLWPAKNLLYVREVSGWARGRQGWDKSKNTFFKTLGGPIEHLRLMRVFKKGEGGFGWELSGEPTLIPGETEGATAAHHERVMEKLAAARREGEGRSYLKNACSLARREDRQKD